LQFADGTNETVQMSMLKVGAGISVMLPDLTFWAYQPLFASVFILFVDPQDR